MKYIVLTAGQEWNDFSWEGALDQNGTICFKNKAFPHFLDRFWVRKIFRNRFLILVFWYPLIKMCLRIPKTQAVLLIYDWNLITMSDRVIRLLKNNYPDLTIAYIFTNITKISGATTFGLLDHLKDVYDIVFAFDPKDAEKYGFEYSRLIYEPKVSHLIQSEIEYDLFYVGQAKDRYPKLIEIFKQAISQGLRCRFFITGVSEEDQYGHPDIIYNQQLPYIEVLKYINKSRCLVDAIQGESSGMTIKTSEAVFWNKKLITTNVCVQKESYYKPSNILVYGRETNIKKFLDSQFIPYSCNDRYEFSHKMLFAKLR